MTIERIEGTVVPMIAPPAHGVAASALTPAAMLDRAVQSGADIAVLERLMALHERWEAGQARKAFDRAMAAAKAEMPAIVKNRQVGFESKRGGSSTSYKHADLAQVIATVRPVLNRFGLDFRFTAQQEGNRVRVTCHVTHTDGHSEATTLESGEDHSGNKNSIQAIGSAASYLSRYTLMLALGLAAAEDDDGRATSEPEQPATLISAEALEDIQHRIFTLYTGDDIGRKTQSICSAQKVRSLDRLTPEQGKAVIAHLEAVEAKRKEQQ